VLSRARTPERARNAYTAAYRRGSAYFDRSVDWVERQEPTSRKGATIGSYRRFQRADVEAQKVRNPAQRTVLIPDGSLINRPFHALRIRIGADRQHRARESQ
jgi:hypothetical protein